MPEYEERSYSIRQDCLSFSSDRIRLPFRSILEAIQTGLHKNPHLSACPTPNRLVLIMGETFKLLCNP